MVLIKKVLWAISTLLLLFSSIYFIFKLKALPWQIGKIKKVLKFHKKGSTMNALFLSLGGRIGVGSMAGVGLAIYIGGIGSIFWLVITSFITSILSFVEVVIANKYKIKSKEDYAFGGPSYYLKYGLNKKVLGIIYAFILLFCYIFGFTGIQANTITLSIIHYIPISKYIIGLIITLLTFIIILGGIKKIMKISNIVVPFMSLLYILSSLTIVIINKNKLPSVVSLIISDAFRLKPFFSSFIPMFLVGIQRGIFSSEAGIGTCATTSCATDDTNYIRQGIIQTFGIYISIIICLLTALVILVCDSEVGINGITTINHAFHYSFGFVGDMIILISLLLFSFSTILTGYYYGESGLIFLSNKKINKKRLCLKILTCLSVFVGAVMKEEKIWDLVDILVSILAIINVSALFCLRKEIKSLINKENMLK